MPQCLVLCLYLSGAQVQLTRSILPPMTLPQSLLPEGARFAGVGLLGQDDAYLYVVKGAANGMTDDADAQLMDELMTLARKDVPQDFVLSYEGGAWSLTTKDLEQDVF